MRVRVRVRVKDLSGEFVQTIETRQGHKIACLEEVAYNNGWLSRDQLQSIGKKFSNSSYGKYILSLLSESVLNPSW